MIGAPYIKNHCIMVQSYLDLLTEDLLIKIIEMVTESIENTLPSIENKIEYLDDIMQYDDDSLLKLLDDAKIKCSYIIPYLCLSIRKNEKPKKMKIMVNNKKCYVPYDIYDIYYGYIKYEIPDKYLNSYAHLYSRYPLNNVIIIAKKIIDNGFNVDDYVSEDGVNILYSNYHHCNEVILQSPVLKNPLYFDILRETNKLYVKLSKFCYYLGRDYVLNKTFHINNKKYQRGPRYPPDDGINYKSYRITPEELAQTPEEFAKYNYITANVLLK